MEPIFQIVLITVAYFVVNQILVYLTAELRFRGILPAPKEMPSFAPWIVNANNIFDPARSRTVRVARIPIENETIIIDKEDCVVIGVIHHAEGLNANRESVATILVRQSNAASGSSEDAGNNKADVLAAGLFGGAATEPPCNCEGGYFDPLDPRRYVHAATCEASKPPPPRSKEEP